MSQLETLQQRYRRLQRWSNRVAERIKPFSLALMFLITFTGKLDIPAKTFFSFIHYQQPYRVAIFLAKDPESVRKMGPYKIVLYKI
jgi:hypothetical protein